MEKRNTRFTNRKSGGDRNFTLYLYFLIYKGGQGKKQAAGKSSSPSAQAQNSPAEKYRTSLQLSWQHNVAQLSECRCKMQDGTFLTLGWFFWFGIQNRDCKWIMYQEAWRLSRRWRNSEAKQTDRQLNWHSTAFLAPILYHAPPGFIYFLILSLCFFLFLSSFLFCLFTTFLYPSFFHSP